MRYAGFWRRFLAYVLDIVPITLLVAAISYAFFGFDQALADRVAHPGDFESRWSFLEMRNQIRDISSILWLVYSTVMDASPLQGTLGKVLLGLRVVDSSGAQLSLRKSAARNFSKIISALPLGLGFVWAAFSKEKRAWHDMIAGTRVVHREIGPKHTP